MLGINKAPFIYTTKFGTYVYIDGIRIAKTHCTVWTLQAAECYLRGCNCENCPTKDLIENLETTNKKCLVKHHVRAYFLFNVPPPEKILRQAIEKTKYGDIKCIKP